jgi:hypothetical protein
MAKSGRAFSANAKKTSGLASVGVKIAFAEN